ncbi:hypothetical protein O3M35_005962 [Rhynocoris fuscipes]|uniref:Uncharacterized protein n=1 Tax=Rhynocoris fuscipes TaxID=488301 RepID=A0AAW1DD10_9HEMI
MPGLHHGNLCWGNRKSFYIYGEFPTEISSMDIRRYDPVASTTPVYISSSGYYGYQRITNPHKEDETMDTAEDINEEAAVTVPLACRKRQSNELNLEHVKRTRYHGERCNTEVHEDLLFLENYLRQTHGCDYYNFNN